MSKFLGKKNESLNNVSDQALLETTTQYEKRIYDLEQLLDIAKSFCNNLNLNDLLESVVYISMAQMHVLGAEIFVRDIIGNEAFVLETDKDMHNHSKIQFPANTIITTKLLELAKPVTVNQLRDEVGENEYLTILANLNPTLIVPLIQKNHLNGILLLQERIAIDDTTTYTDYEQEQIMSIASLAAVAINNAALLERSSTDMMTHLKLKYFFFNLLTEAMDTATTNKENIAVLMFDIDFFKRFNDTYGHECGDFVLIAVADLIRKSLREADVASRYGGEEFCVLLNKNAGKQEAMLVAERIRTTIDEHDFVYNEHHLHVTISCGVSVFDVEKNKVDLPNKFVNQADQALYISKNSGRNRVTFFEPQK